MTQIKNQLPSEIVDVCSWPKDEHYNGIFPKGSKVKFAYFCPDNASYNFLIRNPNGEGSWHRYLYKLSNPIYPTEYWSEVIAYIVGCFMGVTVPPAFVAKNSIDDTNGVLIEWFYQDYPQHNETFVEGTQYMKRRIPDFDIKNGTQHNFNTVLSVILWLEKEFLVDKPLLIEWAKIFVFDAIIGNTDRHQENWGIIYRPNNSDSEKKYKIRLSPAFDNGSSLGRELSDSDLDKFKNIDHLIGYITHGKFHMRLHENQKKKTPMLTFIKMLIEYFPILKPELLQCITFSTDELRNRLVQLTNFNVTIPLTMARIDFLMRLIEARKIIITQIISEV